MDKAGSVLGHRGGLGGAQSLLPQPIAPGEPGVGGYCIATHVVIVSYLGIDSMFSASPGLPEGSRGWILSQRGSRNTLARQIFSAFPPLAEGAGGKLLNPSVYRNTLATTACVVSTALPEKAGGISRHHSSLGAGLDEQNIHVVPCHWRKCLDRILLLCHFPKALYP